MTVVPYTSRNPPPPLKFTRPYRPYVFNARSKARFERMRGGEIVRHLGREPSFPERLLINRVISLEWWLLKADHQIDSGRELSAHDVRGRLAAETRLRLDLSALGLTPREPSPALPDCLR